MLVLKFGGTSLAGAERIDRVTSIVGRAARGRRLAVVVSALAGVTNALETALRQALTGASPTLHTALEEQHLACTSAARATTSQAAASAYRQHLHSTLEQLRRRLEGIALLGECPPATRDQILAVGERLAAPLVTLALRRGGMRAETIDGSTLIATGPPGTTGVDFAATRKRVKAVLANRSEDEVAVVTGFVAGDAEGRTTTLGRGASDYSATILGAAAGADRVEIWTDVDGVLSAEPRLVPRALPLRHLTYDEAADLAFFGARILHPRTLEPLVRQGIPLLIRNTLRPRDAGTRVDGTSDASHHVRAVTALPRVVRFLLRPAGGRRRHLEAVQRLDPPPLLSSWEAPGQTLSVVVPRTETPRIEDALARCSGTVSIRREELSLVAVVDGSGALLSRTAAVALRSLAESRISVLGLVLPAAAPRTMALLIERSDLRSAVKLLHHHLVSRQLVSRPAEAASREQLGTGRPWPPSAVLPCPLPGEGEGRWC